MQRISLTIHNLLKHKPLKLQRQCIKKINQSKTLNLFYCNNKFYASTTKISEQHPGMKALKKQTWYQDYKSATIDFSENHLISALQTYYKIIQTMQSSNQKGQAYYYKIFQKILQINVILNRPLQTQQNIYKLIKTRKQLNKNPILVYENYQDLMVHQLQHNVQKAVKLGKALLSQSQINNLPINIEKSIRILLGNGYLLLDNNADAKRKYGQVLQMKPTHRLKGIAMNNLSVGCWWHKNPLFKSRQLHQIGSQIVYQQTRINRDFKQTKQLLMNSIGALENIQQLSQNKASTLQSLLNQITETMILGGSSRNQTQNKINEYVFNQKLSLKPIYNLIQYYIYNDPIQKPLILAWMRILIKNAAKFNCPQIIDQITPKYYLLNGDMKSLKDFLLNTIRNKKNFIQILNSKLNKADKNHKQIANIVQLLKLYQITKQASYTPQIGDKNGELNKQIDEKLKAFNFQIINELQSIIVSKDPYYFKRQFLIFQELSFMKSYNKKLGLSEDQSF